MAETGNIKTRGTGNPGRSPQQTRHQVLHTEPQSLPSPGKEDQIGGSAHHLSVQIHSTENVEDETENAHAHHSEILSWTGWELQLIVAFPSPCFSLTCTELRQGGAWQGEGNRRESLFPWYLVSNDLPFAGGQRLPSEEPCAGIQPQLLQFVWHWKHRRTGSQVVWARGS